MKTEYVRKIARHGACVLEDLVYPPDIYCIGCGRPVDPGGLYSLCGECVRQARWANGPVCRCCGKALEEWYPDDVCAECRDRLHAFSGGVTCFVYQDPVRAAIKHLKYGGSGYIARYLGEALADNIRFRGMKPDMLIPVPMYAEKVRMRGYNQAELIARFAAERLGIPCESGILIRTRPTAPMSRLKGQARRKNLEGAFAVPEKARGELRGARVMLVDDIYTTGTTMDCCSEVLLRAGAADVKAASVAAGVNQRPLPPADCMEGGPAGRDEPGC